VLLRCGKWLTVCALVVLIGGHWFALQSAAWVGMAVNFSKTESVSVALQKTFDGKHLCKLCKIVKAGQASEKKQDLQKLEAKIDFQLTAGSCGLFPPRPIRHFTPFLADPELCAPVPALPPPKVA
jgi:hypothetical protein